MRRIFIALLALTVSTAAVADGINVPTQLKSKIITGTRDLTATTGSVAYTGVGFQPTTCLFTASRASQTSSENFFGMVDSALGQATNTLTATGTYAVIATFTMILYDAVGTSNQAFAVTSLDADGFTGTWTKTGTPTGTGTFYTMCFR